MHTVRVHYDPDCGSWWAEDGEGYVAVSDSMEGIESLVHEGLREFHGLDRADVVLIRDDTPTGQPAL